MLQESQAQPEFAILRLGPGLSSAEELKDSEEDPGPCPKAALRFVDGSSLVSASPSCSDQQLSEPAP